MATQVPQPLETKSKVIRIAATAVKVPLNPKLCKDNNAKYLTRFQIYKNKN